MTSEAIQGMKTLKLNCQEFTKLEQISRIRQKELEYLSKDSWLWSIMTFVASVTTLLVSALVIGLYSLFEDHPFASGEIFTTLALLNQLTVCLSVLPVTLPIFIKGYLSLNRLQTFWRQHESADKAETKEKWRETEQDKEEEAFSMQNAQFCLGPNGSNGLLIKQLSIQKGSLTFVLGNKTLFFLR